MFGFSNNKHKQGNPETIALENKRVLDVGQLPRLINLRIEKAQECECKRCGDLLDNLHTKTKLLEHYHEVELPGLTFWTQYLKDGNPVHFETQLQNKIKLTPKELTRHDEFIDSLVEVEHDWKRSQSSTCVNEDTDDFWLSHYLELKRVVNDQRKYENESLDELRDEVLAKAESEVYFADDPEI